MADVQLAQLISKIVNVVVHYALSTLEPQISESSFVLTTHNVKTLHKLGH